MISSSSLPTIIIFERHWDEQPKNLGKKLVTELAFEGYDTICFEFAQDLSMDDILSLHAKQLREDINLYSQAAQRLGRAGIKIDKLSEVGFSPLAQLMQQYVSSKHFYTVTEKIKQLPASLILKETFKEAQNLAFTIKGIDINTKELSEITSLDLTQRMSHIDAKEEHRIQTMTNNLLKLSTEKKGTIFFCGSLHAQNLIDSFKQKNMQNNLLYYFPHSNKNYDDSVNDLDLLVNETLKNSTYCLQNESDVNKLFNKILDDVKKKNIEYQEEILDNSSKSFLTEVFKLNFKTFKRLGDHVDALLDISQIDNEATILSSLRRKNIKFYQRSLNECNHLVVPEINTTETARKIRRLQ